MLKGSIFIGSIKEVKWIKIIRNIFYGMEKLKYYLLFNTEYVLFFKIIS